MTDISANIYEEKKKNPAELLIDVYQGRLPRNIKDVFKIAKALVVGNEIVAPVVNKLAETPITNIVVKTKGTRESSAAEEIFRKILLENLGIHDHLKGISFDINAYSNAFSSVYFAPTRYLVCPRCEKSSKRKKGSKFRWRIDKLNWTFKTETDGKSHNKLMTINFYGDCPNGHKSIRFKRKDVIFHSSRSLRIIRWDPFYMKIDHYRALGRNEYYYEFSMSEKKRIKAGDRIVLCEYPWTYIQAAINDRLLKISKAGFWHFKLEGISGVYEGWGTPRILSILTALYTFMCIVKANEATSEGRINDLTIISPLPNRGGTMPMEDPIQAFGMTRWLSQTKAVIEKFRKDRTLTAFLPFPVNSTSIYGKGKMQLVTNELTLYIRNIVAALGLPEDVIFSGGNYTSIAVAARILANQADNARKNYNNYLDFMKDTISKSLTNADFGNLTVELQPYESPDDFQRTNMMVQMALTGKYPWGLIYKRFGTSLEEVINQLEIEVKKFGGVLQAQAKVEGRTTSTVGAIQQYFQMVMANEMAKWQTLQQNVDIAQAAETKDSENRKQIASHLANSIAQSYPPDMWPMLVQDIAGRDSELSGMVSAYLEEIKDSPEQPVEFGGNGEALEDPTAAAQSSMRQLAKRHRDPDKGVPRSPGKL